MGLGRSRIRRRMDREAENQSGQDQEVGSASGGESSSDNRADGRDLDQDLGVILSYLLRSGQVRILTSGRNFSSRFYDDEDDDVDEYEDDYMPVADKPDENPNPDTSAMDTSSIKEEILLRRGTTSSLFVPRIVFKREIGCCAAGQGFSQVDCRRIAKCYLPNTMETVASYRSKAFCGTYSTDGKIFLSACHDQYIRLYNTSNGCFKLMKCIRAKDVGWSVLDTAFSSDGNYLIYSSWSDCVHICNIHGDSYKHDALHMCPEGNNNFCMFSLRFSYDNREILGGANDGCLYIYDRDRNERIERIDSHEDHINAVAFADSGSQILFSGGDDGLVKVWDRRTLSEYNPEPVGTLAGHVDGVTFIDSRGDCRYLISNSKDQSIKLWDIRKFSSHEAQEAKKKKVPTATLR